MERASWKQNIGAKQQFRQHPSLQEVYKEPSSTTTKTHSVLNKGADCCYGRFVKKQFYQAAEIRGPQYALTTHANT